MIRASWIAGVGLALLSVPTAFAADLGQMTVADLGQMTAEEFDARHTGYISFGVGPGWVSTDSDPVANGWMFSAAGRANFWIDADKSLQLDIWGDVSDWEFGFRNHTFGGAVHASRRDSSSRLHGLFASIGMNKQWDDSVWGTVGVEGQHHYGNTTLYGQFGYTRALTRGPASDNIADLYGHAVVRHFFNPNFMMQVNGGVVRTFDSSNQAIVYRWGAGLEYAHKGGPLSGFVDYYGNYIDRDAGGWYGDHAVLFGFRLGTDGSLMNRNISGATLMDMNPHYGEGAYRN